MNEDATAARDPAAFLSSGVLSVARGLLGCRLITEFDGRATGIVIDEVEAYGGAEDPASHAFRGRTKRNGSMFRNSGTLYVYRSYGVHWCANIVTGPEGEPSAVLVRGGVASVGIETMEDRRGRTDHLTDGPGKLCSALAITGRHDGTSVLDGPVRLLRGVLPQRFTVQADRRVGITKATDRLWRFVARLDGGSSTSLTAT